MSSSFRPLSLSRRLKLLRILAACAPLLLGACSLLRPSPPGIAATAPTAGVSPDQYRELAVSGRVFALDPAASRVRIYVFRGGRAAGSGHNHVLSVPKLSGFAFVPERGLDGARFDLQFAAADLQVDDAAARHEAGSGFTTAVDAEAIKGTRDHMLGERGLDAARYPLITLHSVAVAGELPRLIATIAVTLHGTTHELLVPLEARLGTDELRVSGAFALRQTDFGVTPYSVLGGLLTVQDEIAVDFVLSGRPARF